MKKIAGATGAFLLASCVPLMQGAIQISFSTNGGVTDTICGTAASSDGPVTCSASGTGVTIGVLLASSNSPGSSGLAEQSGVALLISTTSPTTLNIWMSAQDFASPTTPPGILYASSLSLTSRSGIGTAGLESCVDGSNGLTPPTNSFCSAPEATLTNATLPYSETDSQTNTVTEAISSLTTIPYSLEQQITLTLGAGSNLNVLTSQLLTPVPEPASLALLGSALLGVGLLFRKKLGWKRS